MDSRWITQYGALFCVLNHVGQVVSWRLTSKLTFENVVEQLMMLKRQLDQQELIVIEGVLYRQLLHLA